MGDEAIAEEEDVEAADEAALAEIEEDNDDEIKAADVDEDEIDAELAEELGEEAEAAEDEEVRFFHHYVMLAPLLYNVYHCAVIHASASLCIRRCRR